LDEHWHRLEGGAGDNLILSPGKHVVRAGIRRRPDFRAVSNPVEIEITPADAKAAAHEAAEGTPSPWASVLPLRGEKLLAARKARDHADRTRAAYEQRHRTPVSRSAAEAKAFQEAVTAYEAAINDYPGTEIAFYCRQRLGGLYGYRGELDNQLALLKATAAKFAGTPLGPKACVSLGLHYLQGRHDPAAAIPWLERVYFPGGGRADRAVPGDKYNEGHVLFLSAQQTMAKCEIRLGRPAKAAVRYAALIRRYPQYEESLSRAHEFEMRSVLSDHSLKEIRRVIVSWMEEDKEIGANEVDALLNAQEEAAAATAQRLALAAQAREAATPASERLLERLMVLVRKRDAGSKAEADEVVRDLTALGDEAISPLMDYFKFEDQSFAFRHRAVRVLETIRSSEAQKALLDIALGRTPAELPSMKRWAARAFIATLDDPSHAARLLASDDDGVQNVALLAIAGQRLDAELVARLGELLGSSNHAILRASAKAMAEDPASTHVREKVSALVEAMGRVKDMPKAAEDFARMCSASDGIGHFGLGG